jgi:hypothetical protein
MDRIPVDLDMIISSKDLYKATRYLREKGFKVIVYEPYTVTLTKRLCHRPLYTAFSRGIYIQMVRDYSKNILRRS